jgi:hypothetical protein
VLNARITLIVGALVAVACLPTEPCACTPGTTSTILYGQAPGAGTADVWRRARVDQLSSVTCAAGAPIGASEHFIIPPSGSFRFTVISFARPGDACFAVTFLKPLEGVGDSLKIAPFIATLFRNSSEADSTEIVLPP